MRPPPKNLLALLIYEYFGPAEARLSLYFTWMVFIKVYFLCPFALFLNE